MTFKGGDRLRVKPERAVSRYHPSYNLDPNTTYVVAHCNESDACVWLGGTNIAVDKARMYNVEENAVAAVDGVGEVDPNGISAKAPGSKLDAGKLLPRLVLGEFGRALTEVVAVGTAGARKYTPRGWLEVPNGHERYAEAADRHSLKVWIGHVYDTDNGKKDGPVTEGGTGKLHKAQVIWNLLAELELELRAAEPK